MPFKVGAAGAQVIKPSATEQHNNSTERWSGNAAYIKVKETLIVVGGWIRTSFDLKTNDVTSIAYGQVYKNDVALGTEQSSASTLYTTKTEDLPFSAGDRYQIYAKAGSAGDTRRAYVRNQKVSGTIVTDYEDTAGY